VASDGHATEDPLHRIRRIALSVVLVAAVVGAGTMIRWWIPNRRISDLDYLNRASPDELRDTAHQVLRFPWGNDHDACLVLFGVGDESSIPYLQRAIRRWHSDGDTADCTLSHCRDALRVVAVRTGPTFAPR